MKRQFGDGGGGGKGGGDIYRIPTQLSVWGELGAGGELGGGEVVSVCTWRLFDDNFALLTSVGEVIVASAHVVICSCSQ